MGTEDLKPVHKPDWPAPIDPAEIESQRAKGWPDFHPETYCHECGRPNPTWWIDSAMWNQTRGDDYVTIRCPSCFAFAWEAQAGGGIIWELRPDPQTGAIRRGEVTLPPAVAPDDADLRAAELRGEERVAKAWEHWITEARAARDAALAGERAAREALARVEALIDPEAGMAITPYGNGVRFFEERNIRAALSPTPPEDLGQPPHGHGENVCPGNVPHEECCGPCHVARRAALSPTPPDTAYPAGHGWTPSNSPFGVGEERCRVMLARYKCNWTREEHDPDCAQCWPDEDDGWDEP